MVEIKKYTCVKVLHRSRNLNPLKLFSKPKFIKAEPPSPCQVENKRVNGTSGATWQKNEAKGEINGRVTNNNSIKKLITSLKNIKRYIILMRILIQIKNKRKEFNGLIQNIYVKENILKRGVDLLLKV